MALLDDLLREAVAATTDDERALIGQRIARVEDVMRELSARVRSDDRDTRYLALHFVVRLGRVPPELASAIIECLRSPIDRSPLGDETALVLVACGLVADEVGGFRDVLAAKVRAVEAAKGERAPVMQRLARETLDKVDAALDESRRRRRERIAELSALIGGGRRDDAAALIERDAASHEYPELARAAAWEEVGRARAAAGDRESAELCLERALADYRWHASGATSGGEGLARMLDVERLERELASSRR